MRHRPQQGRQGGEVENSFGTAVQIQIQLQGGKVEHFDVEEICIRNSFGTTLDHKHMHLDQGVTKPKI